MFNNLKENSNQTEQPIMNPAKFNAQMTTQINQVPVKMGAFTGRRLPNTRLIIIVAISIVLLAAIAIYFIWATKLNVGFNIFSENKQTTSIVNENLNINQNQQPFNYQDINNWTILVKCLSYKNQDIKQYFPAALWNQYLYSSSTNFDLQQCANYGNEADAYILNLIKTDNDQDGLNDMLERIYLSSDMLVDTDQDTYSDLTEVINGFDPRVPAKPLLNDYQKSSVIIKKFTAGELDVYQAVAECKNQMEQSYSQDDCVGKIYALLEDRDHCTLDIFPTSTINMPFMVEMCKESVLIREIIKSGNASRCNELIHAKQDCLDYFSQK